MSQQWKRGDIIQCDMPSAFRQVEERADGFVKGIASTPVTDLHGHKVIAGAFDSSIKAKGLNGPGGVKLLAFHDTDRVIGNITRLETVQNSLHIESQLAIEVPYVKDIYTITKHVGGLNFPVGFQLEDFEFVDDKDIKTKDDPWLVVKKGDLIEVSVVAFPSQTEAKMTFVKSIEPDTVAEFERALVAAGRCTSRSEAHEWTVFMKKHAHLFQSKPTPSAEQAQPPAHPLLDVSMLKPMAALTAKARAILSS